MTSEYAKSQFLEFVNRSLQVNDVVRNRIRIAAKGAVGSENIAEIIRDVPAKLYARGSREKLLTYYEAAYGPFPYPQNECRK